jgi:ligand-binding SRPBCC domain-containing protein
VVPHLFHLEREQRFTQSRERVFAYVSDAANLSTAMPSWLRLEVLTPTPIAMDVGTRIEYRLRIYGIPVRWESNFTLWEPPHRFAYEQVRGPFRSWRHEHRFVDLGDASVMTDLVDYAVPGGRPVQVLVVGPLLDRLFRARERVLSRWIPR